MDETSSYITIRRFTFGRYCLFSYNERIITIDNTKLNTISSVTAPLPQWPGDFKWSNAGVPKGYHCDRIWELKQPANQHWRDNFFCWMDNKADPGIRFNMNGKLHRSIIMKI